MLRVQPKGRGNQVAGEAFSEESTLIDREISAGAVVAYLLWTLSLVLCGVAWLADDLDIGRLSLIVCGAAVTATVRTYFVCQGERIRSALTVTSVVRGDASVRPLR